MPEHIPPRALGHLLSALDHLNLAKHYIENGTTTATTPNPHHILQLVLELKHTITFASSARTLLERINADDQSTEMKDVACDRTPISDGYPEVILTKQQFAELNEYSTSIPTGATIGKRWKRCLWPSANGGPTTWLMGEFVAVKGRDDVADITWKRIEII